MAGSASDKCKELARLKSGELNGSYWLGTRPKRVRVVAVVPGDKGNHFAADLRCHDQFGRVMYEAKYEWEKRGLVESRFHPARWWVNGQEVTADKTPEEVRCAADFSWVMSVHEQMGMTAAGTTIKLCARPGGEIPRLGQ